MVSEGWRIRLSKLLAGIAPPPPILGDEAAARGATPLPRSLSDESMPEVLLCTELRLSSSSRLNTRLEGLLANSAA